MGALVDARHISAYDYVRFAEVTDGGSLDYYSWHIPNAVPILLYGDLLADISTPNSPSVVLGRLLRIGIGVGDEVVLYDEVDNRHAALAFMILRAYGYEGARLLNGGKTAWRRMGKPTCTCNGHVAKAVRITVKTVNDESMGEVLSRYFVGFSEVMSMVSEGRVGRDVVLIDTRSWDEYVGTLEIWGHIPGAINIPWNSILNPETNEFKDPSEIRELFQKNNVLPSDDIVLYCRTGARSSLVWFALTQLLGYGRVKVYLGSWLDWLNHGGPIRMGELP